MTSRIETDFTFRTKDGYKRPTIMVAWDAPDAEEIVELLQGEDANVVGLLVDTARSLLIAQIRGYVDADADFDQAKLDALLAEGKIGIEVLANLPKSERSMLTKEDLEAFAKAYIAIMPAATGKDVKKVEAAAGLFIERYKRVAGDNAVLSVLQDQLGIFIEAAGDEVLAEHKRAVTYLVAKVEELLSVKVTADAL